MGCQHLAACLFLRKKGAKYTLVPLGKPETSALELSQIVSSLPCTAPSNLSGRQEKTGKLGINQHRTNVPRIPNAQKRDPRKVATGKMTFLFLISYNPSLPLKIIST